MRATGRRKTSGCRRVRSPTLTRHMFATSSGARASPTRAVLAARHAVDPPRVALLDEADEPGEAPPGDEHRGVRAGHGGGEAQAAVGARQARGVGVADDRTAAAAGEAAELLELAVGEPVADRRRVALAHGREELLDGAHGGLLAGGAALGADRPPDLGLGRLPRAGGAWRVGQPYS